MFSNTVKTNKTFQYSYANSALYLFVVSQSRGIRSLYILLQRDKFAVLTHKVITLVSPRPHLYKQKTIEFYFIPKQKNVYKQIKLTRVHILIVWLLLDYNKNILVQSRLKHYSCNIFNSLPYQYNQIL